MLPTQSSYIFVHKMHVQLPITASALQLIIQVQKQLRPTYVNALLWSTPNKSIVFHFICMSLKLYREGGQKETGRGPGATAAPVCWWATLSWNVPLAPKWSIRHCRYKRYLGLKFHLFSSAHADAGYCADDDQHIWNKCCALIEQLYFSESASIPASSPGRRGLSFLLWSWKAKGVKLETMTSTFKGALSLNSRLQLQIAITQSRTVCICNKQHFGHRNSSTDLLSLLLLRWVGDTASA